MLGGASIWCQVVQHCRLYSCNRRFCCWLCICYGCQATACVVYGVGLRPELPECAGLVSYGEGWLESCKLSGDKPLLVLQHCHSCERATVVVLISSALCCESSIWSTRLQTVCSKCAAAGDHMRAILYRLGLEPLSYLWSQCTDVCKGASVSCWASS